MDDVLKAFSVFLLAVQRGVTATDLIHAIEQRINAPPEGETPAASACTISMPFDTTLKQWECAVIKKILEHCRWNIKAGAETLNIFRKDLYRKCSRYGINLDEERGE